ncbi:MAG: hypothetical protein GY935_24400 [Gammaproteobacteria bacterium]|nr:hypothetical protein [Gammaproteobacteria bacterium]
MRRGERPMLALPRPVLLGFVLLFAAQVFHHHLDQQRFESSYRPLGKPLGATTYRSLAMGSEQLLGYLLAIRLQLHDNQSGQHFRYDLIDYEVLIDWLDLITEISPGTEYPMLLASRVYTTTRDRQRLRLILDFIQRRFDDDPQLHWRRLAEASVIAKHNLGDLDLALSMAEKIAHQPANMEIPNWARDFQFLLLAELNELESAIAIIEALLQTEAVNDPDERHFLEGKLSDFQQKLFESRQKPRN